MERHICAIIAKNIGAEDEIQSAYDNLAEFIENFKWKAEQLKGLSLDDILTTGKKIEEISQEERVHRTEFNKIYKALRCPENTQSAGVIESRDIDDK